MDPTLTMTPERMSAYILDFKKRELPRLNKLYKYYIGDQKILRRSGPYGKPNNKVAHPFGNYIVDINVGYFLGEAITYNSSTPSDENDEGKKLNLFQKTAKAVRDVIRKSAEALGLGLLPRLLAINAYNDEAATNAELGTDAGIYGMARELLYLDEDAEIRFTPLDPRTVIPIFDNTVENRLLYGIRYWDDQDILSKAKTEYATVYSRTDETTYRKEQTGRWALLGEPKPHYWGEVPINLFSNNRMEIGDFELVITQIDAYDSIQSDTVNDVEAFADAYLALIGFQEIDTGDDENADDSAEKQIRAMKDNRVLLLGEGGDAKWLTKNVNDTYLENLKDRTTADIHKFSKTPALTDQDFAANASGVAIRYKLMGLEAMAAKKERAFRKGLQRRIELICNMLAVKGTKFDYTEIGMSFKRNVPANLTEIADALTKVGHILSKETQVGLLPVDTTYAEERERMISEAEDGYSVPADEGE
jgi:SPP1 family phage portal protein